MERLKFGCSDNHFELGLLKQPSAWFKFENIGNEPFVNILVIAQVKNSVNEQNTRCEEYDSCDINYFSESAKVKSDLFDE